MSTPVEASDREIFETINAAEQVAQRLRGLSKSSGPETQHALFYTRIRVKSYTSIVDKLQRKYESKSKPYPFKRMEDIVGMRIIVLYDEQIKEAIDSIISMLDDGINNSQPLFDCSSDPATPPWASIKEAIFFKRTVRVAGEKDIYEQEHDRFLNKIKEALSIEKRYDEQKYAEYQSRVRLLDPDARSYSSAHFIIKAISYLGSKQIYIPIELQVRTVAEDLWGEINHELVYKGKNRFVWTPALHNIYNELDEDSATLKFNVENLSRFIKRLHRHYAQIDKLIASSFSKSDDAFDPHASLVLTLIWILDLSNVPENVRKNLIEYNKRIVSMQKGRDQGGRETLISESIILMRAIERELLDWRATTLEDAIRQKLDRQTILLCELEICRLRAIGLNNISLKSILFDDQGKTISFDGLDVDVQRRKLFDEMCKVKDDYQRYLKDGVAVNIPGETINAIPTTCLNYWKYHIIKDVITDKPRAMQHLYVAYDEMKVDASIPEWSIYRIIIPRAIAAELFDDVYNRAGNVRGDIAKMNLTMSARREINVKLSDAIKYGWEAYRRNKAKHERTGDLILGFLETEDIEDMDTVVYAMSMYKEIFTEIDEEALPMDKAELEVALGEFSGFLASRNQIGDDDQLRAINVLLEWLK